MKLDFTRLLAVYGALVSSCAVLWNIYRDFNDRAQIRLAAKIGYVRQDESGQELFVADSWLQDRGIRPEIRPFLKITITNTGRRKLTVTGWGAELKRGEQSPLLQVVPCHLPMELHTRSHDPWEQDQSHIREGQHWKVLARNEANNACGSR